MNGAYIIGEPGVGKSTIVRALTEGTTGVRMAKPFAHQLYLNDEHRPIAAQLGVAIHPKFPGTDRLSMSVQPRAIEWVESAPAPFVFGEGDRLGSQGFFEAMDKACETFVVVLVMAPPQQIDAQRAKRGGGQDERWLAGRQTKVHNLAERWAHRLVTIHNTGTPATAARELVKFAGFGWAV